MITIPYCGYDFRNPDRDRIFRPFGTTSWLFLLVLCPMVFYFSDRERQGPVSCILPAIPSTTRQPANS